MTIRAKTITSALLLGMRCVAAMAQSGGAAGIVDFPCPPPGPVSSDLQAMTQRVLKPGKKLTEHDLQGLLGNPGFQKFLQAQREQRERDWPNQCKYKADDAALSGRPRPRVVFMGDSITENWVVADPAFFTKGRMGRGISGQTTPQMLLRFYADVIALHPNVVHIMAGTNDIGGNTGPTTLQDYENNILAMVDLAQAHKLNVVLAGIPPSRGFPGLKLDPRPRIREINDWLQHVAAVRQLIFIDYGAVLADSDGGMKDTLSNDGVHPTRAGYALMKPLAEHALDLALDSHQE